MHEVPQLVLLAAILGLACYIVWFVRRASRELKGEIRAERIVRDTLASEFPNQRPPTDPPAVQGRRPHLQLVKRNRSPSLLAVARRVATVRQALSAGLVGAVALVAVAVLANPIATRGPGVVVPSSPTFTDSTSSTTEPSTVVDNPQPASWTKPKQPARKTTPTPAPEPTTARPKVTERPTPPRPTQPTATPRPRRTLLPKLPLPVPVPTTVCVPALDVQVCVTR